MNNDPNVLLKVLLDSSDIASSDIPKIQKIVDKYTVHINAELDKTQLMNSVKQVLPQVIKEINKISGTTIKIDIDSSLIEKSIDQIIWDSRRLKSELVDLSNEVNTIAKKSADSALQEQEKCEQGIQSSLSRLEASFQDFANRILGTNLLNGILNFGNTVTNTFNNIKDQLNAIGTTGLANAGIFAFFQKDRSKQ